MLQSNITTRLSLRWLPDPPFETTDTLVLAVGEWYVDLRVDKEFGEIDWALAGQCQLKDISPRRIVFTHDIDSHHNFNISNPCPFIPRPNGDLLETGSMARPDVPGTPMTDYEEVWRYLPIREAGQGSHVSWILESDHGVLGEGRYNIIKVFLGRVGGMFLALYQEQVHERSRRSGGEWDVRITGGNVSARREEWTGRWEVKYLLGQNSGDLPSMARGLDRKPQKTWYAGGAVTIGGKQYIVRAFEDMARVSKL